METLNEQLKQVMQKKKLSFTTVSKALGIARSGLNMWINGNYPGNTSKIENAVKAFIEREKIRETNYSIDFMMTSIAKILFEVAEICHIQGEIGICYGRAGLGKTSAVKEYAKLNSDVILIEADLGYTPKILFSEIHNKLGFSECGTVYKMMNEIVDKFKDSGRLIIIDEAEHLPYKSLELIRRLHDKAGIGILLTGMPRLIDNIRGKRCQYEQLYSRIGIAKKLNDLTITDIKTILQNVMPEGEAFIEQFNMFSFGNTRILTKLIMRSANMAKINNENLSLSIIAEASKIILSR